MVQTHQGIPEEITREDVEQALHDFDSGIDHEFGPSLFYDLVYDEKRYPPKAILGIAARRIMGRVLTPNEFKGGEGSRCFAVLRELGFTVELKEAVNPPIDPAPKVWLISLGQQGKHFEYCYQNQIVAIGFLAKHDLREFDYQDKIAERMKINYPERPDPVNNSLCCWQFANEMQVGDYVVAKIGRSSTLAAGRILSDYIYDTDQPSQPHIRKVEWFSNTRYELAKGEPMPIKTLTEVSNEKRIMEYLSRVYPELHPSAVESNVWIEITHSNTDHGGEGWEFGRCLWSPSRASDGKDWYKLMRELQPGDRVIHINDSVLAGQSIVAEEYSETDREPPNPGPWAGMAPYYRVDVRGYQEFDRQVELGDFLREHADTIKGDLQGERPFRYPFQLEKSGSIKTVQGGYMNKCTPALHKAILSATSNTIEPILPPYTIQDAMKGVFMPEHEFQEILDTLASNKNVLIQGPPGVGKTFLAKRIGYSLLGHEDPTRLEMVQFHQSYAYEDFIQGWRPTPSGGFELKNGIFHQFCNSARDGRKHVFIIDEINRGNLSRIFGELMMLIERDKRGEGFAIPLTYSRDRENRFYVPDNVYLIGLMNTADRSLSMVDYALRRRFSFFSLGPQFTSPQFKNHLMHRGASEDLVTRIISKIRELNSVIEGDTKNLGPGFAVGHSFFCPGNSTQTLDTQWYESVIRNEIAPLIREYWFDDPKKADELISAL